VLERDMDGVTSCFDLGKLGFFAAADRLEWAFGYTFPLALDG
jgi:hypothetical protein